MSSLQIDFVSDVACPWCAIGLGGLEQALDKLVGRVDAQVTFQPFELNPAMGPEGQDVGEHLTEKYGSTPEQQAEIRERIRERGAAVGFEFNPEGRGRIWNTFDAHRLLAWAADVAAGNGPDKQWALKKELMAAYHGRAENVSDPEVLVRAAQTAGLDAERARAILAGEDYALAVRSSEREWQQAGISAVPAVVINRRYLISGGQPAAMYEEALQRIASELAAPAEGPAQTG
jgi:predicted DsbA family dithiol-disulfide isomerase